MDDATRARVLTAIERMPLEELRELRMQLRPLDRFQRSLDRLSLEELRELARLLNAPTPDQEKE